MSEREQADELSPGSKVSKLGGDYRFDGTIVAAFQKLSGQTRYVVEDDRGVLHIYSAKNLAPQPEPPASEPPATVDVPTGIDLPNEPGPWTNGTEKADCRWCYEDEGPPWLGFPHPRSGKIVPVAILPRGGWSRAVRSSEVAALREENARLKHARDDLHTRLCLATGALPTTQDVRPTEANTNGSRCSCAS